MRISKRLYLMNKAVNFGMQNSKKTDIDKQEKEKNKYHQYPLKYIAYTNDFGTAFRPLIGKILSDLSWCPAIGYVGFASLYAGKDINNEQEKQKAIKKELLFQISANLIAPFLLIESVKMFTEKLLEKFAKKIDVKQKKIILSLISISVLLLCVQKLDNIINKLTDKMFKN